MTKRTPAQQIADAKHADLAQLQLCISVLLGPKNRPLRKPCHLRIMELTDEICRIAPRDYARVRVYSPGSVAPKREERRRFNQEWYRAAQAAAISGDWSKVDELCAAKASWMATGRRHG